MIGDKCYTENETNQESTIKVNWLFILGVACICLIIFVISYNNEESNISNALNQNDEVEEIINNLKNKEIGSTFISSVKLLGSGNELLGLEEQYFAKIKVDLSDNDGVNVSKSATIELFKNAEELEARRRYLEAKNDYLDKIYNNKYGKIVCMSNNVPVKQYLYVSGNGLLYFNETFAEGYKYDLCVQFDEAISSMKYFDNKKFNHSQVERIVKQNKRNLDNWKRKNLKKIFYLN